MLQIILLFSFFQLLFGQNSYLKPPMGWNTWNKYNCKINEQLIMEIADVIVDKGYKEAGYTYLNLDDCWQSNERTNGGYIIIDKKSFPNGLHTVANYIHEKGLKFGIYSSAGQQTCAGRMASSGYERQDAETYAKIGVDYLKYDNCNYDEGISGITRYQRMYDAIKGTGRDMFISICNWGTENTWEWSDQFGHSFRSHDDIYNDWKSIVEILNVHAKVLHKSRPGYWADPDMLEIGNGKLTVDESKTHFSLWAAMKAPLILGNNLSDMPEDLYSIVTNKHIIDVNQDDLGKPATRIIHVLNKFDIWIGELSEQNIIMLIVNYMDQSQYFRDINVNDFGYQGSHIIGLDLWDNASSIPLDDNKIIKEIKLPAHGVAMYKFTNGSVSNIDQEQINFNYQHNNGEINKGKKIEESNIIRIEAEDLNNKVYGLARRKGCLSCSGGAYVMALGNVNNPETGTLQFKDIQIDKTGIYQLTIRYLDCFSWSTCGDFWTRRWHLRIRIDNNIGEKPPLMIALKSNRHIEKSSQYTFSVMLKRGIHNIYLDNPFDFGPSIDYIELEKTNESVSKENEQSQHSYAYLLPFWKSGDLLAAENMWLSRLFIDYFWEWLGLCILSFALIYAIYFAYITYSRRSKYTAILSTNPSTDNLSNLNNNTTDINGITDLTET